jgi:hypothetical protein
VRIHDVPSCRTVGAIPAPRPVRQAQFDATGRRLVVVYADDSLELWDLAALPKPTHEGQ